MSLFLNPKYAALEAYTPGEQPRGVQYVKLNTNESPYPPAPAVVAAVNAAEIENLRLYSDPTCAALKDAIAAFYGTKRENVFVSNGSDDILNFAFMVFGADGACFPDITYGFYTVFCALHGVPYDAKPLLADFTIDTADYCGTGKLVVIANPNAPTGIALPLPEIERIVWENPGHVVVIDEAYVDFGAESAVGLVDRYDNLLVVQTYSKSRSMAGARLGFAFGHPALIQDLERIKYATNPYSVNRMTNAAGIAALTPEAAVYFKEKCAAIAATREDMHTRLIVLGFEVLPSAANFLFVKSNVVDGGTIYQKLKDNGILVRHFTGARIRDYNRITVGTPEQTDKLIQVLQAILKEQQQ